MKDSGFEGKIDVHSNTDALILGVILCHSNNPQVTPVCDVGSSDCVFVGEVGSSIRLTWVFVHGEPDI